MDKIKNLERMNIYIEYTLILISTYPRKLIAQTPLEKRDASKLLIVNRETGEMQDKHFHSIIDMLEPGDALVMNDTRVLPARLYGQKEETGGHVELLLLKKY